MNGSTPMHGHPPTTSGQVTATNFQNHPHSAWGFHHVRALHPTDRVWRGSSAPAPFRIATQNLGDISFEASDGTTSTLNALLDSHYTDGFMILHRGINVTERYGHGMRVEDTHILMSTTKSFTGTLAGLLIANGALTEAARVKDILPSLSNCVYEDATVRNLMDMRVGLDFSEDYEDPHSDFAYMDAAGGWRPRLTEDAPDTLHDFVMTMRAKPPHGGAFHYVSPNAIVLGWVLEAVTGTRFADLLSELIWRAVGAEHDADLVLDRLGMSQTEGGLNVSLRDLARFGELHRCEGAIGAKQLLPTGWVDDLRTNGDAEAWNAGQMSDFLPGHHYRSMWYTHREHPRRPFFTLGAFGQIVYIDPIAETVIAKLSCHPYGDPAFDEVLRAFQAIADQFTPM